MNGRRWIAAVLAGALVQGPAAEAASGRVLTGQVDSGGRTHHYRLYLPPRVDGEAAPLLILLHGAGRRGPSMLRAWRALADREALLLLAVDSVDPGAWSVPVDGPEALHAVLERVRSAHPVDPARMYLFGHSAGGEFALVSGLMQSRYFAAVAVHAAVLPERLHPQLEFVQRPIPIAIFAGDQDRVFPPAQVRKTQQALQSRGFQVVLTEISGHGHDYQRRSAEVNRMAWDFLRRHRLPAPPVYTPMPGER